MIGEPGDASVLPDIVTFWHGPLDRLRRLCLASQLAAGHRITLYSFDPLADLPPGIVNADAEPVLPQSFAKRLRPSGFEGAKGDWTLLQFSDFFRVCLMARGAGLWLDADVLLLKPVEIDETKPYFAWEKPRQLGNSALYLPPNDPVVSAFAALMRQDDLAPDWLALRHRLTFAARRLRDRSARLSDLRVAIFGPASLTALARRAGTLRHALPRRSFYAVHAQPALFFEPSEFEPLLADPAVVGFHISPKGRGGERPIAGSLYAWAAEKFEGLDLQAAKSPAGEGRADLGTGRSLR